MAVDCELASLQSFKDGGAHNKGDICTTVVDFVWRPCYSRNCLANANRSCQKVTWGKRGKDEGRCEQLFTYKIIISLNPLWMSLFYHSFFNLLYIQQNRDVICWNYPLFFISYWKSCDVSFNFAISIWRKQTNGCCQELLNRNLEPSCQHQTQWTFRWLVELQRSFSVKVELRTGDGLSTCIIQRVAAVDLVQSPPLCSIYRHADMQFVQRSKLLWA